MLTAVHGRWSPRRTHAPGLVSLHCWTGHGSVVSVRALSKAATGGHCSHTSLSPNLGPRAEPSAL